MKMTEDKLSQETFSFYEDEENCPSCLEPISAKMRECPSCLVVIENFKRVSLEKRMKTLVPGLDHLTSQQCEELDYAWRKVEGLYIDTEIHHHFLHICYRLKSMSFAIKKYSERLDRNYSDETADIMRRRALVLVQESLPTSSRSAATLASHQKDAMSETSKAFLRLFNYVMSTCLISGVFILMMSALTQNKLFFFGLGLFLCLSSLMTLFFLRRELA